MAQTHPECVPNGEINNTTTTTFHTRETLRCSAHDPLFGTEPLSWHLVVEARRGCSCCLSDCARVKPKHASEKQIHWPSYSQSVFVFYLTPPLPPPWPPLLFISLLHTLCVRLARAYSRARRYAHMNDELARRDQTTKQQQLWIYEPSECARPLASTPGEHASHPKRTRNTPSK